MILIIDNYDSFTYNLYQAIASTHPQVQVVRNNQITIEEIKQLAPQGIILSPGPGRPESAGICIDLVHAILTGTLSGIPLLGVCLGHQAITVALGGQVIPANEIYHGKDDLIFHQQSGLYETLPMPFKAGRYHSLIAERESLPSSFIIEAENQHHMIMGMRHQTLPIHGMQFHPESILTPEGSRLLAAFVSLCDDFKHDEGARS